MLRRRDPLRGNRELLDPDWYLATYPDVAAAGLDPLDHYRRWGAAEGRDPSPMFSTAFYRATAMGGTPGLNPLDHYLRIGRDHGLPPTPWHGSPLFDARWYVRVTPDLAGMSPLEHFLRVGRPAGVAPNPWVGSPAFDAQWYLATYRDVAAAGDDPLANWLVWGRAHGRFPHPAVAEGWFDPQWYLAAYPDVAAADEDPWLHYVTWGEAQDRRPSPRFAPGWYRVSYPAPSPLLDFLARRGAAALAAAQQDLRRLWADAVDRIPDLTAAGPPAVAVVVVAWNQVAATLACLRSLAAVTVPLQVLLVDNGSTERLPPVPGIEVLRLPRNLGFVDGVNHALPHVRAPVTLLLNNDATVRPGSLEAALESLAEPGVGAVGGRVVLPTGLLQEAGSFLHRDGSAEGYLRGRPALLGPAMHRRPVDFCSGVFLLVDTAALRAAGGLSTDFRPAYGEEVDLCLRLRAAGLRTVYDPRVVVDHLEMGSAADRQQAIDLQQAHQAVLVARHPDALTGRPDTTAGLVAWPDRSRRGLLVVDDAIPLAASGAGAPRAAAVLRALAAAGRRVTVLPLGQRPYADWAAVRAEVPLDVEIVPEPGVDGLAAVLADRAGTYDTVWVSREHNLRALLASGWVPAGVRVVYDTEALAPLRDAGRDEVLGAPWPAGRLDLELRQAAALAARADVTVAVTTGEASLLGERGVDPVLVVGHELDAPPTPENLPDRRGLLTVGSLAGTASPNIHGLNWFARDVLPLIQARSDAPCVAVGRTGATDLGPLAGVDLVGPVDDLAPWFAQARVFVAPTRYAAGLPLKVVQAAARGVPVVATPLLAEQLGWAPGRDLLVGAGAAGFADAVLRLLTDDEVWRAVRRAALDRVRAEHGPTAFRASIDRVLATAG